MKIKTKNRLQKLIKRLWERIKSSKVIIIMSALVVVVVLMSIIMLRQRDIGAHEAGLQIEELANTIREHYKMRPDYWSLSTSEVIRKNIYPESMTTNAGKLLGYFGNPVEIGMDINGTAVMPTMRNFVITYRDLTKAQCIALASERFSRGFWLGVKEVGVINGNDIKLFNWDGQGKSLPIDKKTASLLCRFGSDISFRFE